MNTGRNEWMNSKRIVMRSSGGTGTDEVRIGTTLKYSLSLFTKSCHFTCKCASVTTNTLNSDSPNNHITTDSATRHPCPLPSRLNLAVRVVSPPLPSRPRLGPPARPTAYHFLHTLYTLRPVPFHTRKCTETSAHTFSSPARSREKGVSRDHDSPNEPRGKNACAMAMIY